MKTDRKRIVPASSLFTYKSLKAFRSYDKPIFQGKDIYYFSFTPVLRGRGCKAGVIVCVLLNCFLIKVVWGEYVITTNITYYGILLISATKQ